MNEDQLKEEPKGPWDIFNSVVVERLTSPLISSFIISWCFTNYQVLIIVFGKATVAEKLSLLNKYFEGPIQVNLPANAWIYGVPLFVAFVYVLLYPFVNFVITKAVIWHNNRLKDLNYVRRYKTRIDLLNKELKAANSTIAWQTHMIKQSFETQSLLQEGLRSMGEGNKKIVKRIAGLKVNSEMIKAAKMIISNLTWTVDHKGTIPLTFLQERARVHGISQLILNNTYEWLLNEDLIGSEKIVGVKDAFALKIRPHQIPMLIDRGLLDQEPTITPKHYWDHPEGTA